MADSAPRLMKDGLDKPAVVRLRAALSAADPDFDGADFQRRSLRGLRALELKDRVRHLMAVMSVCLPDDYERALPIVLAAGENFPVGDPEDSLNGFAYWPLIDWVAERGLDHFDLSLAALRRLTLLFSAEFAVRAFLLADSERALATLYGWCTDPNHHVRRLISEGTRPLLPWGQQLPMFRENPKPVLKLLTALRDDSSEYVRRSVANNLNDIAKDHPEVVVKTAGQWWRGGSDERRALVRHGLRTLVKKGDAGALQVLGFTTDPKVKVSFVLTEPELAIGQSQELQLVLKSTARRFQKLVVDYAVHHQRSGGKVSAKVFKWRNVDLAPGAEVRLVKKHAFVPRSVRRLYPGEHQVEVLVGGRVLASSRFELI